MQYARHATQNNQHYQILLIITVSIQYKWIDCSIRIYSNCKCDCILEKLTFHTNLLLNMIATLKHCLNTVTILLQIIRSAFTDSFLPILWSHERPKQTLWVHWGVLIEWLGIPSICLSCDMARATVVICLACLRVLLHNRAKQWMYFYYT